MKKFIMVSLLLALSRGVFAMNEEASRIYLPAVKSFLANGKADLSNISAKYEERLNVVAKTNNSIVTASQLIYRPQSIAQGSILLVPLQGAVTKEDFCGSIGSRTMASLINQAVENPNIIGTIIFCDSPGGQAIGTAEASANIYAASKKKPIVTYIDNMMASAAYWLGSSANHIIANSKDFIQIGSIGTYVTIDKQDAENPKVIQVYADDSYDKNAPFIEAQKGNYDKLKTEILNPLNKMFTSAVTRNRYGKIANKDAVMHGATFQAKDALKLGMIDQIGTLADAVAFIQKSPKAKA